MRQKTWWTLFLSPVVFAGILTQSQDVVAQVTISELELYKQQMELEQVTNVNQLRDISPTDWAYEALRSLVDRYGCIVGYPNQSYRGNRPLSRYEFAAGLNACLNQIERLIASSEAIAREDLDTINRLSKEFQAELVSLRGKVDNLENRTAFLEDHQFSTTTKLIGQVVFSLTGAFGDERAVPVGSIPGSLGDIDENVVFDDRVRLNFNTSFTGRDLLKFRLDALNVTRFNVGVTGTNMTRLAFDRPTDNDVRIGQLFYRFPVGEKLSLTIDGDFGGFFVNVSNLFNSSFPNPFKGSISRFGRFNPIYYQGVGGAGLTAVYDFNDAFTLNLGYLARNAEDPSEGNGLFNGSYAALVQLDFEPIDTLSLGATYVHAYYPSGEAFVSAATGSVLANAPFGSTATSADHFGFQSSLLVSPNFTLSGWAGLTFAHAETDGIGFNDAVVTSGDDATLFNWAVSLAFPNLGGQGNVGGLLIGQQPRVTDNDGGLDEDDANLHLQAQYRYRIRDGITINPGLLAIINPENNDDNDTVFVGTIRTIFEF